MISVFLISLCIHNHILWQEQAFLIKKMENVFSLNFIFNWFAFGTQWTRRNVEEEKMWWTWKKENKKSMNTKKIVINSINLFYTSSWVVLAFFSLTLSLLFLQSLVSLFMGYIYPIRYRNIYAHAHAHAHIRVYVYLILNNGIFEIYAILNMFE